MERIRTTIVGCPSGVDTSCVGQVTTWAPFNWEQLTKGDGFWNVAIENSEHYCLSRNWRPEHFQIIPAKQTKEHSMGIITSAFKELKGFTERHRDVLVLVSIVAVVDHFFLNGSLRDRLSRILISILDRAEKLVSGAE